EISDWQFHLNGPFECTPGIELREAYCIERRKLSSPLLQDVQEPYPGLHQEIQELLELISHDENKLTKINTLDGSIMADRDVLCSKSRVLKEMLRDPNDTVTMDMTSLCCQIFIKNLDNFRSDEILWRDGKMLLEAAKKYEVTDLTKDIEKRLARDITTENVVERLKIAYVYQLETLRVQCTRLLVEFGKIHKIENDFGDFITSVDKDLLCKIFYDFIL
ncbi:BTB/POZ domain-containing protein, partial [Trifolium medium]|nr:BTB/POZ domain-containing protein [Trifolium medium]